MGLEEDKARAKLVIDKLGNGGGIKKIIQSIGWDISAFYKTIKDDELLIQEYSQAQANKAEVLADEIIDIADNEFDPMKARNRIDVRKWVASKIIPRKYGDRLDINVVQTVDISAAMLEATNRVLSLRDPQNEIDVKSTVIQDTKQQTETGYKPAITDPKEKSTPDDDIFS